MTARHAHRLAVINSVDGTDPTNSHLGYYYHLTGHKLDPRSIIVPAERRQQRDDWPFIGSVVSAKLPQRGALPNAISYPWSPDGPADLRAGQFAGRLGIEHDPLCLLGKVEEPLKFQAPSLVLKGGLSARSLLHRRSLLAELDQSDGNSSSTGNTYLAAAPGSGVLVAVIRGDDQRVRSDREPEELRERYGQTINGMGLLLAVGLSRRRCRS
ncbi:MAG: hypothetical protein CM1200mP2_27100 [Planctomycetaceae bacterium]|nr:MAG: hypothetical protein CM1200mP2_27100 [Planctomycetaceae bacterium]